MQEFWNPQRVEDRAKDLREAAEMDRKMADMRIRFAVTLEDISNAWEKDISEPHEHWLPWGNLYKCPSCGATKDDKTHFCPNCGKEMER